MLQALSIPLPVPVAHLLAQSVGKFQFAHP